MATHEAGDQLFMYFKALHYRLGSAHSRGARLSLHGKSSTGISENPDKVD
jgi:hypothetical protein